MIEGNVVVGGPENSKMGSGKGAKKVAVWCDQRLAFQDHFEAERRRNPEKYKNLGPGTHKVYVISSKLDAAEGPYRVFNQKLKFTRGHAKVLVKFDEAGQGANPRSPFLLVPGIMYTGDDTNEDYVLLAQEYEASLEAALATEIAVDVQQDPIGRTSRFVHTAAAEPIVLEYSPEFGQQKIELLDLGRIYDGKGVSQVFSLCSHCLWL